MSDVTLITALQMVALALLLAEIFLPSAGILALATGATLLGSLWVAFGHSPSVGWMLLALDCVLFPAIGMWGMKRVAKSNMALHDQIEGNGNDQRLQTLVGEVGECATALRPVGHVRIHNELWDATSVTGFVEQHCRVVVVRATANQIWVRPQAE
jgi:membrane-bound serine protease (ClpP class)